MHPSKISKKDAVLRYERTLHSLRIISSAALMLGIMAIFSSIAIALLLSSDISGLHAANSSAANIAQSNSTFGHTLAGIDTPLNSTSLSIINSAPNAYFETAGEMYLNGSIANPIFPQDANKILSFSANGKPSVIYLGSITCIFCGENRWAMALALSRFGNFSRLYTGYSSFGDADVPTLYWTADNYNKSGTAIGNYYTSNILTFISIEDENPITGGFVLNPLPTILNNVKQYKNQTYTSALEYIFNLSNNRTTAFQGTPYTIWGSYQFSGADAAVFGNSTPSGNSVALTYMTHAQVLSQLAVPNDQFAFSEYAAADLYVAAICKSLNNTAQVCSIPAIASIEALLK